MPIKTLKPSGGLMSSKAAQIGVGVATGGAAGGALALAKSSNPALGTALGVAGFGKPTAAKDPLPANNLVNLEQPELGSQFQGNAPDLGDSAMVRRYTLADPQDHAAVIEQGLAGLKSLKEQLPDIYGDIANEVAPALLQAKHFHLGKGQ